jgi:stage IV sporulation protein FB
MNFQTDNPLIFGFPIGTLWGARVRVSLLYLVLLPWLVGPLGWKVGLLAFVVLTVVILLHEFCHVFAARLTGGDADEVILWPLGGLALCRRAPTFQSELLTPAAGPLFHLALCVLFLAGVYSRPDFWTNVMHPLYFPRIDLESGRFLQELVVLTFALNWKLLLLNLLPMLPLDGASMWHAVARHRWEPIVAKTAMLIVSTLTHILLAGVAMNIESSSGIGLLFLSYLLLPITILEWIRLQAANLIGVEMEDSENYESYDDDEEGQPRRTRTPGLLERWKLDRERKRQEREEQERSETEAQLDALLEKVHQTGMDSLSESEKRFLKKASARYRGQNRPS